MSAVHIRNTSSGRYKTPAIWVMPTVKATKACPWPDPAVTGSGFAC
jgi:hypothetical protein